MPYGNRRKVAAADDARPFTAQFGYLWPFKFHSDDIPIYGTEFALFKIKTQGVAGNLAPGRLVEQMYRVVVADKDETTADFFRSLLNGHTVDVTSVGSAGQLFGDLHANGPPDVLVTEAHLPDADVDSLLAKLQRTCPQTLIVVVTADSSKETSARIRMQQKPIFYFTLKPLSTDEMRHVVDDAISVLDGSAEAAGLPGCE